MKKLLITSVLAAIVAIGTAAMAPQDYPDEYLGLPGDNFNLYAVMNLFQQSETLEGFERSLNDESTRINNLDLNNDNYIDYIKVIDYVDGNVHTIVLQAVLDRNDNQDVAVFTVERFRNGSVQIQLIGDEALYGRNYIVEPNYAETPNPGYTGRSGNQNVNVVRTTYVEVATWPVVRYIYLPDYRIWRSSWYWGYYPSHWHPWRPYYWHYYYGYHYNWYPLYYAHFRIYHTPRYSRWNDFYYRDKRVYSRNVTININTGRYKTTYSRPESRSEGEALYAKVHPERASNITRSNAVSRRTSTSAVQQVTNAGATNGTARRSSGTVSGTTRDNTPTGQSTGNVRRSTTGSQPTASPQRSRSTTGSQPAASPQRSRSTTVNQPAASPQRSRSTTGSEMAKPGTSSVSNSTVRRSTTTTYSGTNTVSSGTRSSVNARRSSETSVSRPVPATRSGARIESSSRTTRQQTAAPASSVRTNTARTSTREAVIRQASTSATSSSDNKTTSSSTRRK